MIISPSEDEETKVYTLNFFVSDSDSVNSGKIETIYGEFRIKILSIKDVKAITSNKEEEKEE